MYVKYDLIIILDIRNKNTDYVITFSTLSRNGFKVEEDDSNLIETALPVE